MANRFLSKKGTWCYFPYASKKCPLVATFDDLLCTDDQESRALLCEKKMFARVGIRSSSLLPCMLVHWFVHILVQS